MERMADVLTMDGKPVKLDWARRLDAACRRTPGLGVFVVLALVEHWWVAGDFVAVAIVGVAAGTVIVREFWPKA